jgi:hypothetical protein
MTLRQLPLNSNLGKFTAFSLQLTLWMQITGFAVRVVSSFVWLKMYSLGPDQGHIYQPVDAEAQIGNLSPSSPHAHSFSDEVLGGSIYNPVYYASLFSSLDDGHSLKEVSVF